MTWETAPQELTPEDLAYLSLVGWAGYCDEFWIAYPHIAYAAQRLQAFGEAIARGERRKIMIFMPSQHGKALAVDTPIATPWGWTTMGALRPGDQVFGRDGKPCNVVAVSPVWRDRPVYRVETDDGDAIIADAEHEWEVRLCPKREVYKIHNTERLARARNHQAKIKPPAAMDLPEQQLPVDPWCLGFWLGDGGSDGQTITAGGRPGSGTEDQEWVRAQFESAGIVTTTRSSPYTFGLRGGAAMFRALGVRHNKHVPTRYMRASREQRIALLQGLIDSDGYVAPTGQVEFCNTSRRLADDVRDLVWSLGVKCSLTVGRATVNGKDCGEKYRVSFYMDRAARLPRKAVKCRNSERRLGRYVTATSCGTADTVCIEVDSPDHMFLAGRSLLPTHNSSLVSRFFTSWMLGRFPHLRIIFASYGADLAELWSRRARDTLKDHGARVFGVSVRGDSKASDHWELSKPHRGAFHAVGIGGGASGHPADLGIIDDPVKDREAAESKTIRDAAIEWYKSVFLQRRPKGQALLMTRWQVNDLAGWLLEKEPGQWEVIEFPAIAEEHDVLGRKPGDALCPAITDEAQLERERLTVGPYVWASMYRQRPLPPGEGLFKRTGERKYRLDLVGRSLLDAEIVVPDDQRKIIPLDLDRFITVDTATSEDDQADHTAISAWGYDRLWERLFLLDTDIRRIESPEIMESVVAMCKKWRTIAYIEENSTSKHLLSFMEAEGIPFHTMTPGGKSKFTRAIPASARWFRGGVWLDEGAEYLGVVLKQVYNFTGVEGGDDDFVDTLSMAERVILEEVGIFGGEPGIATVQTRGGKPPAKMPPGYSGLRRPPGM